jgi:parallel beta-helix repeat protein
MNGRTFSVLGVLIIALALSASALPVSAGGKGSDLTVGPGQEYGTIQAAVDAAKPGSKILVYPGTYHEAVSVAVNNLQITAQGAGVVVVPSHTAGFQVLADQVTVSGFEIAFGAGCASGIRFEGSHNTFADNTIYLAGMCFGVNAISSRDADGGSDFNIVERNTIIHSDLGIAIVAETRDAINRGNIIRDNTLRHIDQDPIAIANGSGFLVSGNNIDGAPYGICIAVGSLDGNTVPQGRHTVINNTMGKCAENGISLYAWPGTTLTHNRIAGNAIQDCMGDCLALEAGSGAALSNNQVISNTVSFSLEANGILLAADGADADVSDNLVQGNLVYHNRQNGIYLTPGADRNRILNNEVQVNAEFGIAVAGDDNLIVGNWAHDNTMDFMDLGQGNLWRNNTYAPTVGWAIGDSAAGAAIVHTSDGGRTWQAQGNPALWAGMSGTDISAVDDQTAWAALGSGPAAHAGAILHTTDGGAHWVPQAIPAGLAGGIKGVKGLSRDDAWAVSLGGTVLHTTDGGATWTIVPHPGVPITQVNRVDAMGTNVWIANSIYSLDGGVVHSPDGGLTWRAESLPDDSALTIHAFSPMVVWGSGVYNLAFYRTVNGGDQWTQAALLGGPDHLDDVCAASSDDAWGVQNGDGVNGYVRRVHVAADGSSEASNVSPPELFGYTPGGVTCLDENVAWVVAQRGVCIDCPPSLGMILNTVDGGVHWVQGSAPADIRYWKVSFAGARR